MAGALWTRVWQMVTSPQLKAPPLMSLESMVARLWCAPWRFSVNVASVSVAERSWPTGFSRNISIADSPRTRCREFSRTIINSIPCFRSGLSAPYAMRSIKKAHVPTWKQVVGARIRLELRLLAASSAAIDGAVEFFRRGTGLRGKKLTWQTDLSARCIFFFTNFNFFQ